MRKAYRYLVVPKQTLIDPEKSTEPTEFYVDNLCARLNQYESKAQFMKYVFSRIWMIESHEHYKKMLKDSGKILSVGSGAGEQDVLLMREGYDITSTDLTCVPNRVTRRLFPKMKFGTFDVQDTERALQMDFDSVLITGIDQDLDDAELDRAFETIKGILKRSKHQNSRFVFTLRNRDTFLIRAVRNVLLPIEARLKLFVKGKRFKLVRKAHGCLRTIDEILVLAKTHDFSLKKVRYAGVGVELSKSFLLRSFPSLWIGRKLDNIFHIACNCTIFEFTLSSRQKEFRRATSNE